MFVCRKCKSYRIKTRTNTSFGKTTSTAVKCKECGSTLIDKVSPTRSRR